MSDYKLKDSTKTAMRHILQDSAIKRTNLSLRINEDLHAEYKSLADAYKKISGTSLPLGSLADQLIADLNQICRNEVAMMLLHTFPRGLLIRIITDMAEENTFESEYDLSYELNRNERYKKMISGVYERLNISELTSSYELNNLVQKEAFIIYSKLNKSASA